MNFIFRIARRVVLWYKNKQRDLDIAEQGKLVEEVLLTNEQVEGRNTVLREMRNEM